MAVPIATGAFAATTVEVPGLRVADLTFPAGLVLSPHEHEHACVVVTLRGSFATRLLRRDHDSAPAVIHTEPAGERHANRFGSAGARVLVVQPGAALAAELRPAVQHHRDAVAARLALRAARELAVCDGSDLGLACVAIEIVARAARLPAPRREVPAPRWVGRVKERLHESFARPPSLDELAREAGLHPIYLSRAFRTHTGQSVGGYVRGLRVGRAAERLARSDAALVEVALESGFADQSHLTRVFRQHTGYTPRSYRERFR